MRIFLVAFFAACAAAFGEAAQQPAGTLPATAPVVVYTVPLKGEIDTAQFYIVRRALKTAGAENAAVLLDIDTPGGALDATLDIMSALDNFKGWIIAYVNPQAASAGAYIASAADEIWFAPKGVMGAAEAVDAAGGDLSESMARKVRSFMGAKVRALDGANARRAAVVRAMSEPDFVLEIDGKVLKPKGALLSLTAAEAAAPYGTPPTPLISAGTAADVQALLAKRFGADGAEVRPFALSGLERAAVWLHALAPVLLGLGVLLLYIELKTQGFGLLGVAGAALLVLCFAGNYLAGLTGYEPLLLLIAGILLLGVELYLTQGLLIPGVTAAVLLTVAVVWSGADIWPDGVETVSAERLASGVRLFVYGTFAAAIFVFAAAKALPKTRVMGGVVLEKALARAPKPSEKFPPVGAQGVAVRDLHPEGEIEVGGQRYAARARVGEIARGEAVEVIGGDAFAAVVKKSDPRAHG